MLTLSLGALMSLAGVAGPGAGEQERVVSMSSRVSCTTCIQTTEISVAHDPVQIEYEWLNVGSGDFDAATGSAAGATYCYESFFDVTGDSCCIDNFVDTETWADLGSPSADADTGDLLMVTVGVSGSDNCDTDVSGSFSASLELLEGQSSTSSETLVARGEYYGICEEEIGTYSLLAMGVGYVSSGAEWTLSSEAPANATFVQTVSVNVDVSITLPDPCVESGALRGGAPDTLITLQGSYVRLDTPGTWGLLVHQSDGSIGQVGLFDHTAFRMSGGTLSGSRDFSSIVAPGATHSINPFQETYSGLGGDLDLDGRLTDRDQILFDDLGTASASDADYNPMADLDQDGDIDATDESAIEAQITLAGTCVEDFYVDHVIDFTDYIEFLGYYNNGDSRADLNADGSIDFTDIIQMNTAVNAGVCD